MTNLFSAGAIMRSLVTITACLAVALVGCVPVKNGPLPPPLADENQRTVDESWERALNPVDRLDRAPLLDALILTQGYQLGIDRLTLRSEKDYSAGIVVMEIHINRRQPVNDRFDVSVIDKAGKIIRQFSYSREEVERTQRELCDSKYVCPDPNKPVANDYEAKKRDEIQARLKAVAQIFPKIDDDEQEAKDKRKAK